MLTAWLRLLSMVGGAIFLIVFCGIADVALSNDKVKLGKLVKAIIGITSVTCAILSAALIVYSFGSILYNIAMYF